MNSTTSGILEIRKALYGNEFDYDGFYQGKTGLFYKIAARYYASKDEFATVGTYFAIEFQNKDYKFDAYPFVKDNGNFVRSTKGPFTETTISNTDLIRLVFGYENDNSSNFCWDPFIGLAYTKKTFNGWYTNSNGDPILGSISETKPSFILGFKIGIRF